MSTFRAFFIMVTRPNQEKCLLFQFWGVFLISISDDEVHGQTSIHLYPNVPDTLCHGNSYLKCYLTDDAVVSNRVTTNSTRPRHASTQASPQFRKKICPLPYIHNCALLVSPI